MEMSGLGVKSTAGTSATTEVWMHFDYVRLSFFES